MKFSSLTPEQFVAWRQSLGMSQDAAALRLGISKSSVSVYEKGIRAEGKVEIPLLVALGMAAIKNNIKPYEGENQ